MANELDLYNGELQPYSPQPLAPSHDDWGQVPADYLTEREAYQGQRQSGGLQLFGEALPPGATEEQITYVLTEIAALISADLMRLNHSQSFITAALNWFRDNVRRTPQREQKRHSYNLYSWVGDPVAESFGNAMARAGASQEFVSNCLYLMEELSRRLGASQGQPMPRTAPQNSPGDGLSDAEYNALYDYNEKMKPHTDGILRAKWKDSYHANLRMVDDYLQSLSAVEKAHFDTFLNNGLHALNDPTVILGLYAQAVGAGSIPSGGAALQDEINAIENLMKTDRKSYLKDERLQARYRHLLTLRDG